MLIHISRERVYKAAFKEKEKKLLKKIVSEIMKGEDLEEDYQKFLDYSQKNNYRARGGSLDIGPMNCGYSTLDEFVMDLAKMASKMILKDMAECKEHGVENADGYLYVPLDIYDTLPNGNEYGYPGSGRLILQGFDWSYDDMNNYDYSFVVYMTI